MRFTWLEDATEDIKKVQAKQTQNPQESQLGTHGLLCVHMCALISFHVPGRTDHLWGVHTLLLLVSLQDPTCNC